MKNRFGSRREGGVLGRIRARCFQQGIQSSIALATLAAMVVVGVTAVSATAADGEIPKGQIVSKVVCSKIPEQSYAIYVPSSFTPDRKWPVLYCLDPAARGDEPLTRFREAAEKFGWIVVGSNNSRNGRIQTSFDAVKAIWDDSHARFPIDDTRIYLTGFSGGSRMASSVAVACETCAAGVIGCGAGFSYSISPINHTPEQPLRFAYFGTVGTDDFNYPEMVQLDAALAPLHVRHALRRFEGGHDWAPSDLCVDALAWMEIQAMKSGIRTRDDAIVDEFYTKSLRRAEAFETAHAPYDAYLAYLEASELFAGLKDVEAINAKVASLKSSKEVKNSLKDEDEQAKRQEAIIREITGYAEARKAQDQDQKLLLMQEFRRRTARLRDQARAEKDSRDRRIARRALHSIFAVYYEGAYQKTLDEKHAEAVEMLEVAVEVAPRWPGVYYDLACAYARVGNKKKTMESLKTAIEKGFNNPKALRTEPAFESIRTDAEFTKIVDAASAKAAQESGQKS